MAITSTPALAGTLSESFEDAGASCSSAWFDGCVDGWNGYGANSSIARTHVSGDNTRQGVLIKGASPQNPNGISRTYTLPQGAKDLYDNQLRIQAIGANGEFDVQLIFRNEQKKVLAITGAYATVLVDTSYIFGDIQGIPTDAASVEVKIKVIGASTLVFVEDWELDTSYRDEGPGQPASPDECMDEAEVLESAPAMVCEALGGTWKGHSRGTPAPTESGCNFSCHRRCVGADETVVIPSGY